MPYIYTAYLLSVINLSSIKILLPDIMAEFGVQINWLTWVVNSYTLPLAVLLPICGRISDIYGHRRFFIFGIGMLCLGSLSCGLAPSLCLLIISRMVQAIGAAFLVPASLTLLLEQAPIDRRGKTLGIWGSVGASGAVIGPIFSGLIVNIFTWRGTFICLAVMSLTITIAVRLSDDLDGAIKPKDTYQWNFDIVGSAILITASTSILIGITLIPQLGWLDFRILSSLAAFVLMLYLFYRIEKSAPAPLFNIDMLKKYKFSLGLLVCFLEQFAIAGTLFVMPIYFTLIDGSSAIQTALLLTPTAIAIALVSPAGGRIADRIGPGLPISTGMLLRALSFFMLSRLTPNISYLYIITCLAINGIGFGLTNVPALNSVLSMADLGYHGVVAGVHNMFRFMGQAVGTTVGGIVLYSFLPAAIDGNSVSTSGLIPGFCQVFLLLAAVCILGFWGGVKLYRA